MSYDGKIKIADGIDLRSVRVCLSDKLRTLQAFKTTPSSHKTRGIYLPM